MDDHVLLVMSMTSIFHYREKVFASDNVLLLMLSTSFLPAWAAWTAREQSPLSTPVMCDRTSLVQNPCM